MGHHSRLPSWSVLARTIAETPWSITVALTSRLHSQAGLAACYLSHPDFLERFKWSADDPSGNTVGNRIKDWLFTEGQGSYQRVTSGQKLEGPKSMWRCVFDHAAWTCRYG